ncbi:protein tramtrack, beta isoform-like isoform X1 [Neocloeon triangulifer]|uniref:protein tramtrack, beta isoform-like isoform X1 n=1 Tax=Neocloeon triangulifer TaxID=2078957 RepID=UPI00286F3814|nr:protein tramtrack, beta isoform-like isoform X1 [Neocloeon triangulifer]XP_059487602.1 protein tramtrack, beta isoform-like isoform X1 [Neocloeon triangulifer]
MSSSQRFCLRWNNHQSNLLSVFEQLLQDESFVDVTLAVEGLYLKAHKMVLSACSPYFQTLFVNNPDKHPIVFLKDVPYADMRSLLDFMYKGEVSVDQERLTAFLKVAESLRIKGLTEVNEESCNLPRITSSLLNSVPGNLADERLERHPSPHHFMGHKRPSSSPSPLQNLQHLHTRHMSPSYSGKRKRGRVQESVEKERHGGSGRSSPSSSVSGQHDLLVSGQDCISSSRSPDDSFSKDVGGKRIKDELEPTAGPSNQDSGQTYGNSQDADESGSGVNFGAGEDCSSGSWDASVHFLTAAACEVDDSGEDNNNTSPSEQRPLSKQELLEYVIQTDGSVICKWCGESVPSRTHWYRHKYRLHAVNLFRCGKCFVYFKTKKGYLGHINNSHKGGWKKWRDGPKDAPGEGSEGVVVTETVEPLKKQNWDAEQQSEEKLIADIIERVKREFEAQGGKGENNKAGYCRRRQVSSLQ